MRFEIKKATYGGETQLLEQPATAIVEDGILTIVDECSFVETVSGVYRHSGVIYDSYGDPIAEWVEGELCLVLL